VSKYLSRNRKLLLVFIATLTLALTSAYFQLIAGNYDLSTSQINPPKCQLIKHQQGESCIPIHPQRIITLDEFMLDTVLSLGMKPIAAGEHTLSGSRGIHLRNKAENVIPIGEWTRPKLETILQLKPNLILGYDISSENYKLLSKIAPTVSFTYNLYDWKTPLLQVSEVLHKKAEAEQIIRQYQQRITKIRQLLGDKISKTKVSIARFYAAGGIDIYPHKISFPGRIITDIGFAVPTEQAKFYSATELNYLSINSERLDLLDADVMFVLQDPGSEKIFQTYQKNRLWQLLNVVKNQRIYIVNSNSWAFGNSLAVNAILDDLYKYLLDNE
jgi:iron complex transport system substrate-binding protein